MQDEKHKGTLTFLHNEIQLLHLPEHIFQVQFCQDTQIFSAPAHMAGQYQKRESHLFHSATEEHAGLDNALQSNRLH